MTFLKTLFIEKCPICKKALYSNSTPSFSTIIVKSCQENHYQKEFHPALETYVESYKN